MKWILTLRRGLAKIKSQERDSYNKENVQGLKKGTIFHPKYSSLAEMYLIIKKRRLSAIYV